MSARKQSKKKKAAAPPPRRVPAPIEPGSLTDPTLTHLHYHPEGGILRAHVEQDLNVLGVTSRHGRDVDIAIEELGDEIRSALEDAFKWVAEDIDATPYEAPEPVDEEEEEPE